MKLYYDFGDNKGEFFELWVSDEELFREYLKETFKHNANRIWSEIGEYVDVENFVADSREYFEEMYEREAREIWEEA